jgi:TPR repeat protein
MLSDDDLTIDPFDDEVNEDVEAEIIGEFRLAATKGDADAMFNLGLCYKNGEQGVEKDAATAFSWFQRAAETGGHATAQCNLAVSYYTGEAYAG